MQRETNEEESHISISCERKGKKKPTWPKGHRAEKGGKVGLFLPPFREDEKEPRPSRKARGPTKKGRTGRTTGSVLENGAGGKERRLLPPHEWAKGKRKGEVSAAEGGRTFFLPYRDRERFLILVRKSA